MFGSRRLAMVFLVALMLAVAGCGSSSSSSSSSGAASSGTASPSSSSAAGSGATTSSSGSSTPNVGHLPTAKFALHAGLAFGAFHRYIYKPFKAGQLHGFSHKLTIVKAAAAGLFAYHELKIAVKDAQASPILSKLLTPVNALADKLKAVGASIKGGKPDISSIESANGDITSLSGLAKQSGISIPPRLPSAAQLTGGG